MRSMQSIRSDFFQVVMRALLALFLVPAVAWGFTHYVAAKEDAEFFVWAEGEMASKPIEKQAAMRATLHAQPPSAACTTPPEQRLSLYTGACEAWGREWQFQWARKLASFVLVGGVLILLVIAALGVAAFRNRSAQYASVVLGWRILAFSCAIEVLLQASALVWLTFWLPAYFFEHFSVKLLILVGIGAGVAAVVVVTKIFARLEQGMNLFGETVSDTDAPLLWARIRTLASQVGTVPPDHLVAGIDANFFVTESPMTVNGVQLTGRSLYVSLPLLGVLHQNEADAVLAHELAHLRGGDASSSALLGPKLSQFDRYCWELRRHGMTVVAAWLLDLYRVTLELALMRESRAREFLADKVAAETVGALPLVRSLIKVAAYSSYRARVEAELFARQERHGESIGIAAFVADGLRPFALSSEFKEAMAQAGVPHPFDSHPHLSERMANVGNVLHEDDFGAVLAVTAGTTWLDDFANAGEMAQRMWAVYEGQFADAHEQDLAFRYLPANDAERAVVEKHFPEQCFDLGKEGQLRLAFDGLTLPAGAQVIVWDDIVDIGYEDGYGSDTLKLTVTERVIVGNKTVKVKLPGIKASRQELKHALGLYWHRNKVARGKV